MNRILFVLSAMVVATLFSATLQARSSALPSSVQAMPIMVGQYNCQRIQGMVKWISHQRDYGFIQPYEVGKDIYVHYSAIVGGGFQSLAEGDRVEFCIEQSPRGPAAAYVVKI